MDEKISSLTEADWDAFRAQRAANSDRAMRPQAVNEALAELPVVSASTFAGQPVPTAAVDR